ncbi:hypothetical protein [Oceanivirga miroungae]|uniref:Uncharacterized protein n=1 Tax=Oceanivirga miroungae TaxID=1130046 RepID=A0A6I8M6E0_9FUSO|nr:hypothetical protein [Oceanivirga miroungae]VWL84932.1 hypothetical protein OMES3154_00205 [Oceanivirga miroungae]
MKKFLVSMLLIASTIGLAANPKYIESKLYDYDTPTIYSQRNEDITKVIPEYKKLVKKIKLDLIIF